MKLTKKMVIMICLLLCIALISITACAKQGNIENAGDGHHNSASQPGENHVHTWSEPICGQKQTCLTCGATSSSVIEHVWSQPVCGQKQTCLTCGATSSSVIEHVWSQPVCGQKQTCMRCGTQTAEVVPHTTDDGVCTRCGESIINKQKLIDEENERYEQAMTDLYNEYTVTYIFGHSYNSKLHDKDCILAECT